MSVIFKDGVYMGKFNFPKMEDAWIICQAFISQMEKDFVITSICDNLDIRKETSKHHKGEAFDFRTKHLSKVELAQLENKINGAFLRLPYQLIIEDDHAHVEYEEHEVYLSSREGENV